MAAGVAAGADPIGGAAGRDGETYFKQRLKQLHVCVMRAVLVADHDCERGFSGALERMETDAKG